MTRAEVMDKARAQLVRHVAVQHVKLALDMFASGCTEEEIAAVLKMDEEIIAQGVVDALKQIEEELDRLVSDPEAFCRTVRDGDTIK